jgi:hypothetical protein
MVKKKIILNHTSHQKKKEQNEPTKLLNVNIQPNKTLKAWVRCTQLRTQLQFRIQFPHGRREFFLILTKVV